MKISKRKINEITKEEWEQFFSCTASFAIKPYYENEAGNMIEVPGKKIDWEYSKDSPAANAETAKRLAEMMTRSPQYYLAPGNFRLIRNDKTCQMIVSKGQIVQMDRNNEITLKPVELPETLKSHVAWVLYMIGTRRSPNGKDARCYIILDKPYPENYVRKECFMLSGRVYSQENSLGLLFMPLYNRDGTDEIGTEFLTEWDPKGEHADKKTQ